MQLLLQGSAWRWGMVPTRSVLGYDPFVNHDIEDRLTEDDVLLHANLWIDALKCVCDPLCDIDRTMDVGRKQLQRIDCHTFVTRPDFNWFGWFGVFYKLTRGQPGRKALSVVKHNGW